MRSLTFTALIFLAGSSFLKAQYKFQATQFQQTAIFFNPAFSGIEDFVDVKVGYRNRWAGFGNNPTTAFASGNIAVRIAPNNKYKRRGIRLVEPEAYHRLETESEFQFRKAKRQGFGAWILQNQNNTFSDLGGFISYAYHLGISDYLLWSVGTSFGVINSKIDVSNLNVTDPDNDPVYQSYLLNGGSSTDFVLNLGTIIYSRDFYFGYSANNVVGNNISNVNGILQDYGMHHNVIVGLHYIPKYGYLVIPGVMVEYTNNVPVSWTASVRVRYEDAIWGGLAYRFEDSAAITVGLYITENVALNYAFEYSLSEITGLNTATTHELILAFKLNNRNFSRAVLW